MLERNVRISPDWEWLEPPPSIYFPPSLHTDPWSSNVIGCCVHWMTSLFFGQFSGCDRDSDLIPGAPGWRLLRTLGQDTVKQVRSVLCYIQVLFIITFCDVIVGMKGAALWAYLLPSPRHHDEPSRDQTRSPVFHIRAPERLPASPVQVPGCRGVHGSQ